MSTTYTLKDLLSLSIANLKYLTDVETPDFRLEQAEFNKGKKEWELVVSFLVQNTNKRTGLVMLSEFQYHRIYKKVRISAFGEFLGFYIYNNKE